MSDRANEIAAEFDQVNQEVIDLVESSSDDAWSRQCPAQQCTVAALAAHVGESHQGILDFMVRPLVNGETPAAMTPDDLNHHNAARAAANATRSKADVLDLLRTNGALVSDYIRSLDDDQLAATGVLPFGGDPIPVEALLVNGAIGHPRDHLAALRAAVA